MQTQNSVTLSRLVPPSNARRPRSPEQGVVLVITLLLLSLLAALSLAMVVSVSSDSLINGYYRNYRGAFYAADSGINVARQTLVDKILAAIPAGSFSTTTAPIPAATTATVLSQVLSTSSSGYGSWTPINTNGASGSWNGQFCNRQHGRQSNQSVASVGSQRNGSLPDDDYLHPMQHHRNWRQHHRHRI